VSRVRLGRLYFTQGVMELVELHGGEVVDCVLRHARGDWGIVGQQDKELNDRALVRGERLLSSYVIADWKLYVITEWDRSLTTVMLADEY
jgi:hypothetical protein